MLPPPSDISPARFDELLREALRSELHFIHIYWDVFEAERARVDRRSVRGSSIWQVRSQVTGAPAYVERAGNARYVYADRETVVAIHEEVGISDSLEAKLKARADGRDTYELKGHTYSVSSSTGKGTTSEEHIAWAADQLGLETDCEEKPPTGEGPSLQEVLAIREEVSPMQWRGQQEGDEIAARLTRAAREAVDEPWAGRVHVTFSASYHGAGFSLQAGNASWGLGGQNDAEDDVLRAALSLIDRRKSAIAFYAGPGPRGSTGEPYFEEEG